jgi:hypothetical protein
VLDSSSVLARSTASNEDDLPVPTADLYSISIAYDAPFDFDTSSNKPNK